MSISVLCREPFYSTVNPEIKLSSHSCVGVLSELTFLKLAPQLVSWTLGFNKGGESWSEEGI